MEQTEEKEQTANGSENVKNRPAIGPSSETPPTTALRPQVGRETCASCGAAAGDNPNGAEMATYSYVYALGRIQARFPNLGVEKEFAQATGRAETAGQTDRQTFHSVLTERSNRYLARQLCWILTIEGLETYIL